MSSVVSGGKVYRGRAGDDFMIVHIVSWVYWNGPETGGGGFDWYPVEHRDDAIRAFYKERDQWAGGVARVRLLLDVEVPDGLTREQVTDHLDSDIDRLEVTQSQGGLPAAKVALEMGGEGS